MKLRRYNTPKRSGILVQVTKDGPWGEVAPLPDWSRETLEEARAELEKYKWVTKLEDLRKLDLLPSVRFGLESALLPPLPPGPVPLSALFMGTPQEILAQAKEREAEGYLSAKLKVSQLSFGEAHEVIEQLASRFFLRIDVNRAWNTEDSLQFFSKYPKDLFDYVEEPFKNPKELSRFTHPLAVDESFPSDLSLNDLEQLEHLKALIYKPMIQGGLKGALPLQAWCQRRGVQLVLSSSFESSVGLDHIAALARRLSPNPPPVGIGTRYFFEELSPS